jgi:hypothetical protein
MILPRPKGQYTARDEYERNRQIEQADRRNHKKGQDVEIGEGRLILTSPNGTRYNVTVSDLGNLSATAI